MHEQQIRRMNLNRNWTTACCSQDAYDKFGRCEQLTSGLGKFVITLAAANDLRLDWQTTGSCNFPQHMRPHFNQCGYVVKAGGTHMHKGLLHDDRQKS
jgi:hypothetical protein